MQCIAVREISAEGVAMGFFEGILNQYGIPDSLLTDQSTNILIETFRKFCKLLGVKKTTNNCVSHTKQRGPEMKPSGVGVVFKFFCRK